ncbi:MAG TPA: PAS domain S-box protein [Candidatus Limnocylindria bacterium]|jgi:PAS domain S-box-containing protein|nr:PAS domain S-box protein [Candidatus Limnocylindria bacterium]
MQSQQYPDAIAAGQIRSEAATPTQVTLSSTGPRISAFDSPSVDADRALEALRVAEERYRSIFENTAEGIFQSTPEGRYVTLNPAFARIHGYDSPAEMMEKCQDIARDVYVDPGSRAVFKELMAKHGEVSGFEHLSRRKDGGTRWISLSARAVHDPEGRIVFYEGSIADITERKRHEERTDILTEMGRKLNSAKSAEEAAEVIVTAARRMVGWDAASLDMYSSELDQIQAMLNIDTVDGKRVACAPVNHNAPPSAIARRVIDSGAIMELREPPYKHGSEAIPFGDTSRPSASLLFVPVRDGARTIAILSIQSYQPKAYTAEDLKTLESLAESCGGALNRIRAESALRASEERYQLAVAGSTAALWDWDISTNEVYYAPRFKELLGYPDSEFPPHFSSFYNVLHHDDRDLVKQALDDHLVRHLPYDVEYRLRARSGHYRWINARGQALWDAEGKPYRMAGSILDITEGKAATASLKASEERFQLLSKATNDAIWDWDITADRLWWNEGFESLFGYKRDEIDTTLAFWEQLVHPVDAERVHRLFHASLSGGRQVWTDEYRFRRQDGTYAYVLDRGYVIRDAEGKPIRMIGGITDLTARQEAEEERNKNILLYRFLFDRNPLAMWIYDLETLRFLEVNESAIDQYGYSRTEFLSMNVRNIRPPEDVPVLEETVRNLRQSPNTGIRRHLRKDGTLIDVEIVSQSISFSGREARLVLANNITERKKAQERIAQQAALIDEAQDAIVLKDLEGRILFWNRSAERILGWTREEAVGQRTQDLLGDSDDSFQARLKTLQEKGTWAGETIRRTKSGQRVTMESRWTLVRDEQGQARSILGINTDITERKRLESQFLRAQRMESIGTLAGGIAHDLNNVLAPILMSIDLLKLNANSQETLDTLEMIETSAQRGAGMVRQVLSFARGLDGQRVPVPVKHLLKDMEKLVVDTFPKSIRFKNAIAADIWTLIGDPTQLHQVLLNLCVNARDAMPNGGDLTIKAQNCVLEENFPALMAKVKPGRYVSISVSDTGCGIRPAVIDRIFEPFFTTKDIGKGTGLGLATVLAIVKSHGGYINVSSEPNRGSAFHIYLPADAENRRPADAANLEELRRGKGQLILVVDDEVAIRSVTQQTLQAFGYSTLLASNGSEAVALYLQNQGRIAAVMTDMMMPVMDGPATIAALRRLDPAVKIIGTSGMHSNGGVTKAIAAGIKHFLPKPFTADTLLQVLYKLLNE